MKHMRNILWVLLLAALIFVLACAAADVKAKKESSPTASPQLHRELAEPTQSAPATPIPLPAPIATPWSTSIHGTSSAGLVPQCSFTEVLGSTTLFFSDRSALKMTLEAVEVKPGAPTSSDVLGLRLSLYNEGKEDIPLGADFFRRFVVVYNGHSEGKLAIEASRLPPVLGWEQRGPDFYGTTFLCFQLLAALPFSSPAPSVVQLQFLDPTHRSALAQWSVDLKPKEREITLAVSAKMTRRYYCWADESGCESESVSPVVNLRDTVRLTLINRDPEAPHSLLIEGLGIQMPVVRPGEQATITFQADTPGRFAFRDPEAEQLPGILSALSWSLRGTFTVNARPDQIGDFTLSVDHERLELTRAGQEQAVVITIISLNGFHWPVEFYYPAGEFGLDGKPIYSVHFEPQIVTSPTNGAASTILTVRLEQLPPGGQISGHCLTATSVNGLLKKHASIALHIGPQDQLTSVSKGVLC